MRNKGQDVSTIPVNLPAGDFSVHDITAIQPFLKKIKDGLYLEIGVKHGLSLAIARHYAPEAKIYGIDISNIDFDYKYFEDKDVNFIDKSSDEVARTWNKKIDLLFIDGDHERNQVTKDIKNYSKWVKKDGHIVFHDFDITSTGVIMAVDDFAQNNNLVLTYHRFSKPGLATSLASIKM